MNKRKITRIAFLQEYKGRPEELLGLIDEVKEKGYQAVVFSARITTLNQVRKLVERAYSQGLNVYTFTVYMKGQESYLLQHPEQRMVLAQDIKDQDGLSTSNWGCPFNPDFKKRYLNFLQELAFIQGMEEIWVNDEASLGNGCYCSICRVNYQKEVGGEMPLITEADESKWKQENWRKFLKWRIERWNRVHGEMKKAVAEVNPQVKVVFQSSPAMDLCWGNPWSSAVDLSAMVEHLDGLCADPYYTFHSRRYNPAEVYLSEWCRFLSGIVPEEKKAEIIPQGFSHPTFTRPLDERDGYWAAVIPVACGIDYVAPYTYKLMKCSEPLLKAYEKCFSYDRYFERVRPLKYVGLVHGANTEIYYRPLPIETPDSYDGTRIMPCAESLRHKGIPYSYIPDRRISTDELSQYETIILPEIDCLDKEQEETIKKYWKEGGNIIALGQLGIADSTGRKHNHSLLKNLFNVEVIKECKRNRELVFTEEHPISDSLLKVDEDTANRYMDGIMKPLIAFTNCVEVGVSSGVKVIAEFLDFQGKKTDKPAIVISETKSPQGKLIFMAGFPSRTIVNPRFGTQVRNLAHWILPSAVKWVSKNKPVLRVENWPPMVPMEKTRPHDTRYLSTFEFFPLIGEDIYIGVVTSYFKEPTEFSMVAHIPEGKRLKGVRELIKEKKIIPEINDGEAIINVSLEYNDAIKIFVFEFVAEGVCYE